MNHLMKYVIKYMLTAMMVVCSLYSYDVFASHSENDHSSKVKVKSYKSYKNAFIFNPRTHTWVAVDHNGQVVRSGRGSGGRSYCSDIGRSCRTPTGTYYVISKGGPECRSSRYPVGKGGAKMPYCMFFTNLYAVHGSYDVPNYNASHGCVRVRPSDAQWLSHHFMKIGTKVIIKSY